MSELKISKVCVRIKGGLGNQLFCYAAARRLAIVNNANLVLDDISGFVRDYHYQRKYALDSFAIPIRKATPAERMEPFERYRRGVLKFISKQRHFQKRKYVFQEINEFDSRLLDYRPCGTVYLDGYWQSELYFKDVENVIRQDLRITPPDDQRNLNMAKMIERDNAVGVHVRWFDKPHTVSDHNLEGKYYSKAIKYILERVSKPHFYLFSNDPSSARPLLALPDEMVTCVSHNNSEEVAFADLWLMSQCKHFISANSTFSWWGAWLSSSQGKIVITPKITLTGISAWGFAGLIPDGWIQVSPQ